MRRFSPILMLLVFLTFTPVSPASAWLFGDDTLVTIDGSRYTADDYKRWWKFWNDENQSLPKTPDSYVNFLLLAREADGMELDETPSFKRATRIFLQARTLLMLKYEAVDSQIKITDEEVKARYEERYVPRWLVQRLDFHNEADARKAWDELTAKTLTLDELLTRGPEQGGPLENREDWLRPAGIDPGWADLLRNLAVGEVMNPDDHLGGRTLYRLKEQKGGDEEDFSPLREAIRREVWKQKEDELTRQLLAELYKKYEVKVDQERLDALDVTAADETYTDELVITSTKQDVSEKQFMVVVRKLMGYRPTAAHAGLDAEKIKELKEETVNNILAQSLTNWGALDRHFEEEEPFKWEYQFNRNHRLIMDLEELLFVPQAKVTDEEIKQYYEANIDRYSQPTVVRIQILDSAQGPIDRVWTDVVTGMKFSDAVSKHFERGVPTQEVPANHLDAEVKTVVDKLAVGETSPIFTTQGNRVMVHLVSRTASYPLPLDRVTPSIRGKLVQEKVERLRADYLEQLKTNSKIEIRKRQWKAIQKELGGA